MDIPSAIVISLFATFAAGIMESAAGTAIRAATADQIDLRCEGVLRFRHALDDELSA